MKFAVKKKQPTSRMCFVCGSGNSSGLHARFYELENGELTALFTPGEEHQGYPGRLHGGIASTILDETIGRTIMLNDSDEYWGVTIEFTSRYKKPIPLGSQIRVVARVTQNSSRVFEGSGEILLEDGTIAVEGKGKYLKLDLSKIGDINELDEEWDVKLTTEDPEYIEI
jgi:uncharacterized protein (TIGR00369 family)